MKMKYFGDSYDFVKKFLLSSIAPDAEWAAFPMFTEKVTSDDISDYEAFLGVQVVCPDALPVHTDREKHLSALTNHRHIFLDPDTGIKLDLDKGIKPKTSKGARSVRHVYIEELVKLCTEKPGRVLLVFDQSVGRASKSEMHKVVAGKLRDFQKSGIHGFAYHTGHVFFHVLSSSDCACCSALESLRSSGLPDSRFVHAADD